MSNSITTTINKIPPTLSLENISGSEKEIEKQVAERVKSRILDTFMHESVLDIITKERELPTISTLYKIDNRTYCAYVAGFLLFINNNFNVNEGKHLSELQMDVIIHSTPKRFPHFRLNDVYQVCNKFITG